MPSLNKPRANPGSFITEDRKYLYVYHGFSTNHHVQNIETTVERLDLSNPKACWELIECEALERFQKGSHVLYPMRKLISEVSLWRVMNHGQQPTSLIDVDKLVGAGAESKILSFGGWKPYRLLKDLHFLDSKSMKFEEATLEFCGKMKVEEPPQVDQVNED